MSSSAASAAILSIIRHVTADKWNKGSDRLDEINSHVRNAESALSYKPGTSDSRCLEADVNVLLATVRKAFAGSLDTSVDARGATAARGNIRGRGRGGRRGDGRGRNVAGRVRLRDRLDTIERMLWEAKYSSTFSKSAALAWRDELLAYLHQGQRRMRYTTLFGHLTNEWAECRFGEMSASEASDRKTSDKPEEHHAAVALGRKEMYQQRELWESHVTNERRTDPDDITRFLDDLFHSGSRHDDCVGSEPTDPRAVFLHKIRQNIATTCKAKLQVTMLTVKQAIQGVLSSDQLTSKKRHAMLDISNKPNVLCEIADILNIDTQLASIGRWSWGQNPITIQMRKAINGKYRVYLDMELLDAILVQCIGQFVSVNVRRALEANINVQHEVWRQKPDEARTAAMMAQTQDFAHRNTPESVYGLRRYMYHKMFYLVNLPKSFRDVDNSYDDSAPVGSDGPELTDMPNGAPSKFSIRTDLLRVLCAEMAVQKVVHGKFSILQSDFEWFGPSLPHSTLITIMKYFHFPSELVHFFEAFISMKMRFEEDGENGPVLTRKCGIPISFQMSDGISELLLFTLDFAVNQRTGGSHLYRNHDDLWFWGPPDKCAVAWETICQFTDIMGLRLNKDKTGSACAVDESNPRYVASDNHALSRLPSGRVKWGFLLFDPMEWKWTVDKGAIKDHMKELRFQLKSRHAVMAYVQAYNAYIENFLPNNFGAVVTGLGDSHAVMVLEALQYAQRCLYSDDNGPDEGSMEETPNVAQHVREMIQSRFGKEYEVPDCFLYMGIQSGGLGLANPVPEFAQYVEIAKNEAHGEDIDHMPPMERALDTMKKQLSEAYRDNEQKFAARLYAEWQKHKLGGKSASVQVAPQDSDDNGERSQEAINSSRFMSFGEYIATSEEHNKAMSCMYKTLLNPPTNDTDRPRLSTRHWASAAFHNELKELFGESIAEEEFLSLGLYRTLAEEKVRWDG